MPTKRLIQVVSYISPKLKRLADEKIHRTDYRVSMSAYIEGLMRWDLLKK